VLRTDDLFASWDEFNGLLAGCDGAPWQALDRLGQYLEERLSAPTGTPLPTGLILQPLVLVDGVVLGNVRFVDSDGAVVLATGESVRGATVVMPGAFLEGADIRLGEGVRIESGAFVRAPTVLGDGTQVRHGAYIRGHCLTGARCIIGHATEVKNAIFFSGAQAAHFAYVGDSILGRDVNLGAGTRLANLRVKPGNVTLRDGDRRVATGRRKLGAILGDRVQTGCNAVLSPGVVLGRDSIVLPCVAVAAAVYPPGTMLTVTTNLTPPAKP